MIVSGEAIVRLVLAPDQRVPLQLQLLGREFLDNSRVDSRTLNGIRYDDAGPARLLLAVPEAPGDRAQHAVHRLTIMLDEKPSCFGIGFGRRRIQGRRAESRTEGRSSQAASAEMGDSDKELARFY